jgi:GMP synthase (glutamine-hydrolysing)
MANGEMEERLYRDKILILDFGSQYTQLIARRVRAGKVYCEIWPFSADLEEVREFAPRGIILSGGPSSIYSDGAPVCHEGVFRLGVPLLGICYGMQLMAHLLGGKVLKSLRGEYGGTRLQVDDYGDLFHGLNRPDLPHLDVWMSHGDRVEELPPGFSALAHSENSPAAAVADRERRFYGLQFHPEVAHTPQGTEILDNFIFRICGCEHSWTMQSFIQHTVREIKEKTGGGKVVCALSGGVDSAVAATLLSRALGDGLICIFVDNGLLRRGEAQEVLTVLRENFRVEVVFIDAAERFLTRLTGVTDPEQKRKIIGEEFIRVFEETADRLGDIEYLAQGTLYPDVIESVSFKGPSAVIKSHHNVGGLPEEMGLKLIEPLRELFKDEVRLLGEELGLPREVLWRQPFPGPGLAVRVLGEVNREGLEILRKADAILIEEIRAAGLYYDIWQSFAVLLPVKSVGVMGDERTFENVIGIRAVHSTDGMTADWVQLPYPLLQRISSRIINEVKGVNRVVYDISSKPPSTIEWE